MQCIWTINFFKPLLLYILLFSHMRKSVLCILIAIKLQIPSRIRSSTALSVRSRSKYQWRKNIFLLSFFYFSLWYLLLFLFYLWIVLLSLLLLCSYFSHSYNSLRGNWKHLIVCGIALEIRRKNIVPIIKSEGLISFATEKSPKNHLKYIALADTVSSDPYLEILPEFESTFS